MQYQPRSISLVIGHDPTSIEMKEPIIENRVRKAAWTLLKNSMAINISNQKLQNLLQRDKGQQWRHHKTKRC